MTERPLGIADLLTTAEREGPWKAHAECGEFWLWCRQHEQAHKVGEKCKIGIDCPGCGEHVEGELTQPGSYTHLCGADFTIPKVTDCIDIGPFMTEREAEACGGVIDMFGNWVRRPLGMKVES